jgi:uncharacterized protein YjbJ (UPF0337 family)
VAKRDPLEKAKEGTDAVRDAVERTFEATVGSAEDTRDRAASLLNQVVGRVREIQKRLKP